MTDGEIDLRPMNAYEPDLSMRLGEIRGFRICPHGSRREMGQINLRFGESPGIYYFGHIGYHIDPPYRGHHYAEKALRLVRGICLREGKESVVITTDPDNLASRRTCERLGCLTERQVKVPENLQKKWELSSEKVRYIWVLDP